MISAIQRLILSALLIISTNVQAEVASYFDESLSSEKRVELLMNEMTLDEKIGQMCQFVGEASDIDFDSKDTKSNYTSSFRG
jgi:beta-glucosidase